MGGNTSRVYDGLTQKMANLERLAAYSVVKFCGHNSPWLARGLPGSPTTNETLIILSDSGWQQQHWRLRHGCFTPCIYADQRRQATPISGIWKKKTLPTVLSHQKNELSSTTLMLTILVTSTEDSCCTFLNDPHQSSWVSHENELYVGLSHLNEWWVPGVSLRM